MTSTIPDDDWEVLSDPGAPGGNAPDTSGTDTNSHTPSRPDSPVHLEPEALENEEPELLEAEVETPELVLGASAPESIRAETPEPVPTALEPVATTAPEPIATSAAEPAATASAPEHVVSSSTLQPTPASASAGPSTSDADYDLGIWGNFPASASAAYAAAARLDDTPPPRRSSSPPRAGPSTYRAYQAPGRSRDSKSRSVFADDAESARGMFGTYHPPPRIDPQTLHPIPGSSAWLANRPFAGHSPDLPPPFPASLSIAAGEEAPLPAHVKASVIPSLRQYVKDEWSRMLRQALEAVDDDDETLATVLLLDEEWIVYGSQLDMAHTRRLWCAQLGALREDVRRDDGNVNITLTRDMAYDMLYRMPGQDDVSSQERPWLQNTLGGITGPDSEDESDVPEWRAIEAAARERRYGGVGGSEFAAPLV